MWELPLVLETVSEASGTTIPLPLPYRRLNAEVLEYLEDVAQLVPKDEEARIVVYLPIEYESEIASGGNWPSKGSSWMAPVLNGWSSTECGKKHDQV